MRDESEAGDASSQSMQAPAEQEESEPRTPYEQLLRSHESLLQNNRLVAHEIISTMRIIQRASERLYEAVHPKLLDDRILHRIQFSYGDIRHGLTTLERLLGSMVSGEEVFPPEAQLLAEETRRSRHRPKRPTSVREVLVLATAAIRLDLAHQRGQVTLPSGGSDIEIWVHREALSQIFVNLLSNALKYRVDGSDIMIRIHENPDYSVIYIRNLSPPLDREEEDRIFEYGFRGSLAIEKHKDGSGLGLYISRRIAMLYGMGLAHEQVRTRFEQNDEGKLVWHEFKLYIPRNLFGSAR